MSRKNWSVRPSKFAVAVAVTCAGLATALGVAPVSAIALDVDPQAQTEVAQTAEAPATAFAATADAAQAENPATTDAPAVATQAATSVARIGDKDYDSLDAALADATGGSTIELLADASISSTNKLAKNVTIAGAGHTVAVTAQPNTESGGLEVEAKLVFSNAKVTFSNQLSISSKWDVVLKGNGALEFRDGATATFADSGLYVQNPTAACGLTLDGATTSVTFSDLGYTAIMAEGKPAPTASVNVNNGASLIVEKGAINGITGMNVNVTGGSKLSICDNGNQGLVRCNFVVDASTATISRNDMGITGYRNTKVLSLINGGTLTMEDNTSSGIFLYGGNVDVQAGAHLSISGTGKGYTGEPDYYTGAIATYRAAANVSFADGATVELVNNPLGAVNNAAGTVSFGAGTVVTGNGAREGSNVVQLGGGIKNSQGGKVTVREGAVLCNNSAVVAGDDVYSDSGMVRLPATGSSWTLDEQHDGTAAHAISGWFKDGLEGEVPARWEAHASEAASNRIDRVAAGSFEQPMALKAAHGLLVNVDYKYVGDAKPDGAVPPAADNDLEDGSAYTGKTVDVPEGWTFDGWYTDEACTTKWVDGTALDGSMTLYGKWSKKPEKSGEKGDKPNKSRDKKLPQTGDANNAAVPVALAGAAAVCVAGGLVASKRRK